jgi:hypothetical protein
MQIDVCKSKLGPLLMRLNIVVVGDKRSTLGANIVHILAPSGPHSISQLIIQYAQDFFDTLLASARKSPKDGSANKDDISTDC